MSAELQSDYPTQSALPPEAPAYLRVLMRYRGVDPALVRLDPDETSALTGHAPKTLEAKRSNGTGPAFMKVGRRVQYRLSDVLEYMDRSVFVSTREAKTAKARQRAAA